MNLNDYFSDSFFFDYFYVIVSDKSSSYLLGKHGF